MTVISEMPRWYHNITISQYHNITISEQRRIINYGKLKCGEEGEQILEAVTLLTFITENNSIFLDIEDIFLYTRLDL